LLASDFSLRGTGHISYSESYNRLMYRRKAKVLGRALDRLTHRLERRTARPSERPRALDVGSGTGFVLGELLARGFVVEGSDLTSVSLERLASRYSEMRFHHFDLGKDRLALPDDSFDLITIMDVAYHVTDDTRFENGIGEVARLLAHGGFLLASDGFGEHDREPAPHVRFRSFERWERVASRHRLTLLEIVPLYRWLSRDMDELWWPGMPHRMRGMMESVLELALPRRPHLSVATFEKR